MRWDRLLRLGALTILGVGCSKARPVEQDVRGGLTWQRDIAPVFEARCVSCHQGASDGGSYELNLYLGVLGNGTHAAPDAVAGDPNSVLVRTLDPSMADAVHQPVSDLYLLVRQWVVDDRLAYFSSSFHGGGILNANDPQFHGEVLRANGWNFSLCASCHGQDFAGGLSGRTCNGCHAQGVTACTTCHGRYGQSESHPTHVSGGVLGRKLDCSECHLKPSSYTDVGHLFGAQGQVIQTPVPVVFGMLASASGSARQGPPTWNASTHSCSNVYCHGAAFTDSKAKNTQPRFDAPGTGQAACGTCHGLPPSGHAPWQTQCSSCHGRVFDANRNVLNPALHINGVVDIGDNSGTCSACHGNATSPAPPFDLSGQTATSSLGVGAHRSHVQGLHKLSAPIPCGGCHYGTPATVNEPGHFDSPPPAKVFPGTFNGLAAADGVPPSWDRTTATCATYCHGLGAHLADDTSAGLSRIPVWTSVGVGAAGCGTCHGIPPQDGIAGHASGAPLTSCAGCHSATMDPSGAIIVSLDGGVPNSAHINGVIDVFP